MPEQIDRQLVTETREEYDNQRRQMVETLSSEATIERIHRLATSPMGEWTDEDREFLQTTWDGLVDVINRATRAIGLGIEPIRVPLAELCENWPWPQGEVEPEGWLPGGATPLDEFRHIDGLPGISERCWADVWNEEAGEYGPCNGPAANDLGTCENHQL